MRLEDIQRTITEGVKVDHSLVATAKVYAVRYFVPEGQRLVETCLLHMKAEVQPIRIVIHPTHDLEPQVQRAIWHISCRLAVCEAIWGLVHGGVMLPGYSLQMQDMTPRIGHTTVVPGGGGHTGDWTFEQFRCNVLQDLSLAPSYVRGQHQLLAQGDLYLTELAIPNLHPGVAEALQDAVRCFRQCLYTPCLSMLTAAVEGAWVELGLALAGVLPAQHQARAESLRKDMMDVSFSLARRIAKVRDFYEDRNLCEGIWARSGVERQAIRQAAVWSDQVRDSRNVLHYGHQPALANTYEKVAVLLIAAVPCLRDMYKVIEAVR